MEEEKVEDKKEEQQEEYKIEDVELHSDDREYM